MRISLFIIILIFPLFGHSQDFNTVYYNEKWEITSIKYGKYYRNSGFDEKTLKFDSLVIDHYMDGSIEMTGNYIKGAKEGKFIYYYPDQTVRLISFYSGNLRSGTWTSYFENGQVNKVVEYKDGKERIMDFYDTSGTSLIKNLTGKFRSEMIYNPAYSAFSKTPLDEYTEKFEVSGKLIKGLKDGKWTISKFIPVSTRIGDGVWKESFEKTKVFQLNFDNGILVNGWLYHSDNSRISFTYDTLTYLIPEPEKIKMTESIFNESGQMIKQNYVIKAVLDYQRKSSKKVSLNSEAELSDFFDANYSHYLQDCSDSVWIRITLKFSDQGQASILSINPKLSSGFEKEAIRVIDMISNFKAYPGNNYIFNYRIRCLGELEYKK